MADSGAIGGEKRRRPGRPRKYYDGEGQRVYLTAQDYRLVALLAAALGVRPEEAVSMAAAIWLQQLGIQHAGLNLAPPTFPTGEGAP